MKIYINTLGRINKQTTYDGLSAKWQDKTYFVVTSFEAKIFQKIYGTKKVIVLPDTVIGLSQARQWLLENIDSKFPVFADDDIQFFVRRIQDKLTKAMPEEVDILFDLWEEWLLTPGIALVGISLRFGNNRIVGDYAKNTRIMSFYAFDRTVLIQEGIRFDRVPLMQDLDVTLSLLERGYHNYVTYLFAHSQKGGSGASGGCSDYRTPQLMRQTANKLMTLHPRSVAIKAKQSKSCWKGMEKKPGIEGTVRTDVNVQWRKAFRPKKTSRNGEGIAKFFI